MVKLWIKTLGSSELRKYNPSLAEHDMPCFSERVDPLKKTDLDLHCLPLNM